MVGNTEIVIPDDLQLFFYVIRQLRGFKRRSGARFVESIDQDYSPSGDRQLQTCAEYETALLFNS